jgi:hypothetical protein
VRPHAEDVVRADELRIADLDVRVVEAGCGRECGHVVVLSSLAWGEIGVSGARVLLVLTMYRW